MYTFMKKCELGDLEVFFFSSLHSEKVVCVCSICFRQARKVLYLVKYVFLADDMTRFVIRIFCFVIDYVFST